MCGGGEAYHLEPLARCIKKSDPRLRLVIQGLWRYDSTGAKIYPRESPVFADVLNWKTRQAPPRLSKNTGASKFKCFLGIRKYIKKAHGEYKFYQSIAPILRSAGVIHLQSLFESDAFLWILRKKPRTPLVVSCWGSDVLRVSDVNLIKKQQIVLNLATVITCSTPELKEILLAKFGRNLEGKISYALYNPEIDLMDVGSDCAVVNGGNGWLNIAVGHNGFRENNHIELIDGLSLLSANLRSRIMLHLPMTYGASSTYIEEVSALCVKRGLAYKIYQKFMDRSAMFDFLRGIDVQVFGPVSDSLSATVTQALACGRLVFLGDWLPNKLRRTQGFYFYEFSSAKSMAKIMEKALFDIKSELMKCRINSGIAQRCFSEKSIGDAWVNVYQNAINPMGGSRL